MIPEGRESGGYRGVFTFAGSSSDTSHASLGFASVILGHPFCLLERLVGTRILRMRSFVLFSFVLWSGALALAQDTGAPVPAATKPPAPFVRDYRGPQVHIPGIFMTPVPNAPFSATVNIVSRETLPDGSEHVVKTVNHVARESSGVIYNERRVLVPASYSGEPRLLSALIYDPSSRLSISLDPYSHLAREVRQTHEPSLTPGPTAPGPVMPGTIETDLGEQTMNGVSLHGLRRERTLAADRSGTGKPVVITDDYWYAPALSVYLIIRHNDPRTGEQLVGLAEIDRAEPDATRFRVPDDYKVVDETPLPRPTAPAPAAPRQP